MHNHQNDIKQQVGAMIREARKAKGLTQKEVADRLGVTESAVNRYENGKVNITLAALQNLVATIGATLDVNIKHD